MRTRAGLLRRAFWPRDATASSIDAASAALSTLRDEDFETLGFLEARTRVVEMGHLE